MESDEKVLKVFDTDISFGSLLEKEYTPPEVSELSSNEKYLLIIPNESFRGKEQLYFPETTEEFMIFAKESIENQEDNIKVDILADKDSFRKLNLHSISVITVATFMVTAVALPIAVGMVSCFLYDCLSKYGKNDDDVLAELNIIVETKEGKNKKIYYRGHTSGVKDILENKSVEKILTDEIENGEENAS